MISVLIPWRPADPWRGRLKAWVERRWNALYANPEICYGAGPAKGPFNRSAAINEAFRQSSGDVLVVADADTVMVPAALDHALYVAREERRWALPYTAYYNVDEELTGTILALPAEADIPEPLTWLHRLTDSVSGLVVMPRAAFEAMGGFDERFVSWGHEDRAAAAALTTLWGPVVRVDSYCIHLWHPAPESGRFKSPHIDRNVTLYRAYERAQGNPAAMKKAMARR